MPLILLALALVVAQAGGAPSYDAAKATALARCDAIDAGAYQSGLAFDPDGYKSYYERSECLQKVAVRFRDAALCARVRERRSLLWSSWGYSPANCLTLVAKAVDEDTVEIADLRRRYRDGGMLLEGIRVERNGNGRDYDVIPSFTGTAGHGYTIALAIVPPAGQPVVIHEDRYYVDPRSALHLFIRQQDIRSRFPAFQPGRTYQLRATATFTLPEGAGSRMLSDTFLERVFPRAERTRTMTVTARF